MSIKELINIIKSVNTFEDIDEIKSKNILPELESNLSILKKKLNRWELSRFLYYAIHSLNRFSIPTSYYHQKDDFVFFNKYLKIFEEVERNHLDNILSLQIDSIYWELFSAIENNKDIDLEIFIDKYENIHKNNSKIINAEKRKEYLKKSSKFLNLFKGIVSKTLTTKVTCLIPMSPVKAKTIINAIYEKDSILITLEPTFKNSGFIQTDNQSVISRQSESNWQNSTCKISIEIDGYKDLRIGEKSLYIEYESEELYKPKVFTYIFLVLEKVFWKIQLDSKDFLSNTLIEPNDIDNVTYEVKSNGLSLEWIMFPLTKTIRIEPISRHEKILSYNLDEEILWHIKCQYSATKYLSLGNTNLSMFWLNIGIEFFINYRISNICNENGIEEDKLFTESKYKEIQKLIKKQVPEKVFEKIRWGKNDKVRHHSLYKKISILDKNNFLKKTKKEVLKHYSSISKERNLLFHGSRTNPISSEDVLRALKSYKWLLQNF